MITLDELKKIARMKGISNLGYAEKDYLLDVALFSLSKNTKNELVFKGGTCLYKFYKINRFSEDIDFSAVKEINIEELMKKIIHDLGLFGIEAEVKEKKERYSTILLTLLAKGPLYNGNKNSLCSIRIDINLKSEVVLEPTLATHNSIYPDIPPYSLLIMQEKEILAEKMRAIINRDHARDVYDLWFLLERGILFDKSLIEKKLDYYNKNWNHKEFILRMRNKKDQWDYEIKQLMLIMGTAPAFKDVEKAILQKLNFSA